MPMNKVQVGAAPSPNLKTVRSKIGSLENASYKPGGGKVKIENRKLDFSKAQPKIAAKNEKYTPSGGDKKVDPFRPRYWINHPISDNVIFMFRHLWVLLVSLLLAFFSDVFARY